MPSVVVTVYLINDRPASFAGFQDTFSICLGRTRTLNGPIHRSESERMQLIYNII